jgi:hypothetical protein
MKASAPQLAKQLGEELTAQMKANAIDHRQFAKSLGVPYRTLNFWLSADRNVPAHMLPVFCKHLEKEICAFQGKKQAREAFKALDILEEAAGRVVFDVPHSAELEANDFIVVQRLISEVGEALQSLARTLQDNRVEDHEMPETLKEIDDVITECVRLKRWLHMRCAADKLKYAHETSNSSNEGVIPKRLF